jgi:hypothetical protein
MGRGLVCGRNTKMHQWLWLGTGSDGLPEPPSSPLPGGRRVVEMVEMEAVAGNSPIGAPTVSVDGQRGEWLRRRPLVLSSHMPARPAPRWHMAPPRGMESGVEPPHSHRLSHVPGGGA